MRSKPSSPRGQQGLPACSPSTSPPADLHHAGLGTKDKQKPRLRRYKWHFQMGVRLLRSESGTRGGQSPLSLHSGPGSLPGTRQLSGGREEAAGRVGRTRRQQRWLRLHCQVLSDAGQVPHQCRADGFSDTPFNTAALSGKTEPLALTLETSPSPQT